MSQNTVRGESLSQLHMLIYFLLDSFPVMEMIRLIPGVIWYDNAHFPIMILICAISKWDKLDV